MKIWYLKGCKWLFIKFFVGDGTGRWLSISNLFKKIKLKKRDVSIRKVLKDIALIKML